MTAIDVLTLWTPRRPSLQLRFELWLRTPDGLAVYLDIRDRAFALLGRGVRHYGIAALWEAARYDHALRVGPDEDGWKLNNDFRSRLARRLMDDYPELDDFFSTRGLRA